MTPEGNPQIFANARKPTIHGGVFAAVHGNIHINSAMPSERYGLKLLIANISEGAFHNAAERGDPPRCHPHTCWAVRSEIMEWIKAPEARSKFILWLYGPAGAGKTAIAQSIAEECELQGLLAASFFFSRRAAGRNDPSRFVATLAYQLSLSIPEIREPTLAAIEKDPAIFSRAISAQMHMLIIAPLASISLPTQPRAVVVDGIDECGPDGEAQTELLSVLGGAISKLQHVPLIFFVASRPEYEIRLAFNTNPVMSLTKKLVLDDTYRPDVDIESYLISKFQDVQEKQLALGTKLPSPWPSESDIKRLVQKSSGQFIFVATVIKFIDSRQNPVDRLNIILGLSDPGKETPFAHLDTLYRFILSSVDDLPKVLEVLTLLMLAGDCSDRLSVNVVEQLLGLEVRRVLIDMHALVLVPPLLGIDTYSDPALRIHHASLYDFLTDASRSQDLFIDEKQGHIMLSQRWLGMLSNYELDPEYHPSDSIKAFVYHCGKSPPNRGIADDLGRLDMWPLLERISHLGSLYDPDWSNFFICAQQQAGNRADISPRLQSEFHEFIIDRLAQHPPLLQATIPAYFLTLKIPGKLNIFQILLHSASQSMTEFRRLLKLDTESLNMEQAKINPVFVDFFKDKTKSGRYSVRQQSYVTLAKQIFSVIRRKANEEKYHIGITQIERLLKFYRNPMWFAMLLSMTPIDTDLAQYLHEHALQYQDEMYRTIERRTIAMNALIYIRV